MTKTDNLSLTLDEPKYRAKEAAKLLGIGLSTFWLYVKNGRIAQGVKVSNRITVWPQSVLNNFWESLNTCVIDKASKKASKK
jgi:predicted DNA-binding transcriptional regulator AlpA